jgi:type VI secretion system secreted protein VgrG
MPEERATVVRTALGDDAFTFVHFAGRDEINRCFDFTVKLISTKLDIDPLEMLGKPISIEAESGDPKRWFTGLVASFGLRRIEDRMAHYEAIVRPWFWFLHHTTDCRIYQNMSVVEIVEDVFSRHADATFEKRLQGSYPAREYCVQYDETDLDFVQRLLEHEGISYFFEYADGAHTMVLADAMSKMRPAPGYETVEYHFEDRAMRRDREYMTRWLPSSSVRPGGYAHTDYDFTKPGADLMAQSQEAFAHALAEGEHYRHPGAHLDVARGDGLAAIRREELQAPHRRVSAGGTVRGLFSGCTFKLEGFPREDQNDEYLVVRADYRFGDPGFVSGAEAEGGEFHVALEVAPTSIPFRPPRSTRRPVMRGPQTATVVGPSGEEIFTDEYARVKVQFHWDRLGKRDQNSSCFLRVSQTWAGAGWGFIQIPRIGQEVIVDFLDGDPDRPIVTGRVYNAKEMPPYGLPGNATQSGLKTNSSPGGGGWNELRFEDKAGSEEVYFQAEKDHNLLIKNDRSKLVQHDQKDRIDNNAKHSVGVNLDEDVGNNKTTSVGVDRTVTIGNNDTESVGVNRSLTVGSNETISIGSNSTETIGVNHSQTVGAIQTISVGAARVDTVGAAETRSVGAVQTNTIGLSRTVTVGASQTHSIGAKDSWTIGAAQEVSIGASQTVKIGSDAGLTIGGARTTKIAKDDATEIGGALAVKVGKAASFDVKEDVHVKAGQSVVIEATDSILIKCGSAAIALKKDGTISIEGKDITIKGSGGINVKASSKVVVKGSAIDNN